MSGPEREHEGETANGRKHEPEPSRDADVRPIPLGARVRFQRHIDRVEAEGAWRRGHSWIISDDAPGEGVFIGYRYKQNGYWDTESGEYGSGGSRYWAERSRVKVALVVMDAWRSPYTVDPNGLEVLATPAARVNAPVPIAPDEARDASPHRFQATRTMEPL